VNYSETTVTASDISLYYDERRVRQLLSDDGTPYTGLLEDSSILRAAYPPNAVIASLIFWNLLVRRGNTAAYIKPNDPPGVSNASV